MIINSKNDEMQLWHGLPAIHIKERDEWAIFTNINDEVVVGTIPSQDYLNENYREKFAQEGAFECFKNIVNKQNDAMTIVLCLTERCNCRCKYCFLEARDSGMSMNEEMLHKAIDLGIEYARDRHLIVAAVGGEPGIEEQLLAEMVRYTKQKYAEERINSYEFRITTNGIVSDSVIDLLTENNFVVSLSMDGNKDIQDYQRPFADGTGTYDIVERNIKKLCSKGMDVTVRSTVTRYGVLKMAEIVRNLANLGVKKVHFEPVTPGGRGAKAEEMLWPPEAIKFSQELIRAMNVGEELDVDVISFPYMNMNVAPVIFCDGSISNRLVVSPEGNLSTCVEVQSRNHELFGALGVGYYDRDKREYIIEYDNRRKACRGCESLKNSDRECAKCPLNFYCGGGCPTRNYRGSNDTEIVDSYRCTIVREVLPNVMKRIYKETYI